MIGFSVVQFFSISIILTALIYIVVSSNILMYLFFFPLQVTVTNIEDGCVTQFPGTSSAAPIAAGILALALEVK